MIWSWGSFAIGYGIAALSALFGISIFAAGGRYDEAASRASQSDNIAQLSQSQTQDDGSSA
jgi:hypothetical protein